MGRAKVRFYLLYFTGVLLLVLSFQIAGIKAADLEIEGNYSELLSDLETNPIDLNSANVSELSVIPWLSKDEARLITEFRKEHGQFEKKEELFKVEGLKREVVESLLLYLTVKKGQKRKFELRLRVKNKSPTEFGFPESVDFYQRMIFSRGDISCGILTDKDSGEKNVADFLAGYLLVKDIIGFDRILIGNFRPGFGQGLVFSRWSRSIVAPGLVKKSKSPAVEYTSSSEQGALCGAFLEKSIGDVKLVSFWSNSKMEDSKEKLFGTRFRWKASNKAKFGTSLAISRFDPPLENTRPERERFAFEGNQNEVLGLDWGIKLDKFDFFGEIASSGGTGWGIVTGVVSDFEEMEISVLTRAYQPNFHTFHGSGFSASKTANEFGVFTSANWEPTKSTELTLYYDQYRHPWRRYFEVLPSIGDKFVLKLNHQLSEDLELNLKFRSKHSQRWKESKDQWKKDLRLETEWQLNPIAKIRTRIEGTLAKFENQPSENGISTFGGLQLEPFDSTEIYGRLTLFRTDSYKSRIYEFENGHRFYIFPKAVYGRGNKWYILVKQKLPGGKLSVKYWSRTIDGKSYSEVSAQFDFKL